MRTFGVVAGAAFACLVTSTAYADDPPTPADDDTVTLTDKPVALQPPAPNPAPVRGWSNEPEARDRSVAPIILMAAGGAAVITGIVIFAAAPKLPANCSTTNDDCTPTTTNGASDPALTQERDTAATHVSDHSLGIITMAAGGAVAIGGLVWYLLDKPKPRVAMLAPWLSAGSGGVSATGSF